MMVFPGIISGFIHPHDVNKFRNASGQMSKTKRLVRNRCHVIEYIEKKRDPNTSM